MVGKFKMAAEFKMAVTTLNSKWWVNLIGEFFYKFFEVLDFFFNFIDLYCKTMMPKMKFQNGTQI
jgi:hypothetical protein